ncbi:hypothetical protein IKP85_00315 [bacterium]|nr:hypothetical protein [bacterium]
MVNTARAKVKEDYNAYQEQSYAQNPIAQSQVIEGYFYKENVIKELAIRKVNMTLCSLLAVFVFGAFISYYFSMSNEITLNTLSRQVTSLNDENSELQNQLDKLKSFNNVDSIMEQNNLLQKAAQVIEVPHVASTVTVSRKKYGSSSVDWSIGY